MEFESIWRFVQMVLGVGLVIFVHELGHFIAARLCGVRVETFSLGFGPKLFGWRRGETLYQIAALPIGGFCRMAGEDPGASEGRAMPWELRSKSVGRRFFIYSGGVLMNVVFAAVVLPIVLFWGVPFSQPVIGSVEPGSGAWHARLQPGTRVLEVNGASIASFDYIAQEVALGPPDAADLVVLEPGAKEPRRISVAARYQDDPGIRMIGVGPAWALDGEIAVEPDSPAARAGLTDSDRIVGVEGDLPELPLLRQLDLHQDGQPIALKVRNPAGEVRTITIEPHFEEHPDMPMLGMAQAFDVVSDLRASPDLQALGLQLKDRLVRVNDRPVIHPGDLERALVSSDGPVRFEIEREGRATELVGPALERARALALADDIALQPAEKDYAVALALRAPARDVVKDGDRVLAVNGVESPRWRDFLELVQSAAKEDRSVQLRVERRAEDGSTSVAELSARPGPRVTATYGVMPRAATYIYRASSLGEAIHVGFQGTWRFATDTWTMIKRMVLGQVSSKVMGGIISIGVMSYTLAEEGLSKLFFFLCLLSINLAIINVLPIPLLDGGHLFFLLIEKIKGSPVSERVFGYSQVVGLVLILTLLIYVTYNDLQRFVLKS